MLTDEVAWWVSFHISEKPRSRIPNPRLAQQWRERLDRFDGSEWTIAEFCELEGYSQTSFFQWRRRLAVDPQPDAPAFVAVGVDDTTVRMQDASLPGKMRTARLQRPHR